MDVCELKQKLKGVTSLRNPNLQFPGDVCVWLLTGITCSRLYFFQAHTFKSSRYKVTSRVINLLQLYFISLVQRFSAEVMSHYITVESDWKGNLEITHTHKHMHVPL